MIEAPNAYRIGELLRPLTDRWISGPLAVLIAGHYYDFALLLQSMLVHHASTNLDNSRGESSERIYWLRNDLHVASTYLPFIAEAELFEARGFKISDATDVSLARWQLGLGENEHVPRRERFLMRSIRHGRKFLADENDLKQYADIAWYRRGDRVEFDTDILRQSSDFIDIIRSMCSAQDADPKGLWRAAIALIVEWTALLEEWYYARKHPEVQALRAILDFTDIFEPGQQFGEMQFEAE